MRIATAFFLLIVLILVVFGLCGYLLNQVQATNERCASLEVQVIAYGEEITRLNEALTTRQGEYQALLSAYNDLKVKYVALLSSPFTTRETTPAFMAGSLLMGSILTLGITRIKKTSNPSPQSQIVTRQGARNNQVTITMNAQTYDNFQKYLQRPNR